MLNFDIKEENIYFLFDNIKFKQNKRFYETNLKVYLPSILKNLNKPLVTLKAVVYNSGIKKKIKQTKNINKVYIIYEKRNTKLSK